MREKIRNNEIKGIAMEINEAILEQLTALHDELAQVRSRLDSVMNDTNVNKRDTDERFDLIDNQLRVITAFSIPPEDHYNKHIDCTRRRNMLDDTTIITLKGMAKAYSAFQEKTAKVIFYAILFIGMMLAAIYMFFNK